MECCNKFMTMTCWGYLQKKNGFVVYDLFICEECFKTQLVQRTEKYWPEEKDVDFTYCSFVLKRDMSNKKLWRYERKCGKCKSILKSISGHSIGNLHTFCEKCKVCEDCEEGNV